MVAHRMCYVIKINSPGHLSVKVVRQLDLQSATPSLIPSRDASNFFFFLEVKNFFLFISKSNDISTEIIAYHIRVNIICTV